MPALNRRSWRFAPVPLAAARCELSGREFRVLIAICQSRNENDQAWPGVTEIADRTGISRNHVPPLIRALEAAGLVRTERHSGRQSLYTIVYETPCPTSGTAVAPEAVTKSRHSGDAERHLGAGFDAVPENGHGTAAEVCPERKKSVPETGSKLCPEPGTKHIKSRYEHRDAGELWRLRVRGYKGDQSFWHSDWGPRPGRPGCRVPTVVLAEISQPP